MSEFAKVFAWPTDKYVSDAENPGIKKVGEIAPPPGLCIFITFFNSSYSNYSGMY